MKIVPTSKMDLEACANLTAAKDEEIIPFIMSLLEWLQDMNWPVAPLIRERLAKLGGELVAPICNVLSGTDNVWKYWIVSSFLPLVRNEVFRSLSTEVERIAYYPTDGERNEGVHLAAEQLLNQKRV